MKIGSKIRTKDTIWFSRSVAALFMVEGANTVFSFYSRNIVGGDSVYVGWSG